MTIPTTGTPEPGPTSPPPRRRVARWEAVPPPGARSPHRRGHPAPVNPAMTGSTRAAPPLRARQSTRSNRQLPGSWIRPVAILAALVALVLIGSRLGADGEASTRGGLLLLPFLTIGVLVAAGRAGRREPSFDLAGVVIAGWCFRLIGAFFRFDSPVDAVIYHQEGVRLAAEFRRLNFGADTGREFPGTGFQRWLSGLVHVVVFDDWFASFLVFTTFSFTGAYFAYKAFARVVPDGHRHRYALLVFLWPSLVYWPSSLGKEAWMVLGIGVTANGVSSVFAGRTLAGYTGMGLGLAGLALLRPHVALLLLIGFGLAFVVRPGGGSGVRVAGKALGIVLLVVGGSLVAGATAERLKIDNLGSENVQSALDSTQEQTQQGGAAFTPARVRTPADYPLAFVTVLFRPFPGEAPGGEGTLTAIEGLAFLGLALWSLPAWRHALRLLVNAPYVTFAFGYTLGFIYVFSVIANFGILARQRTQLLLLAFVLVCVPGTQRRRSTEDDEPDPVTQPPEAPSGVAGTLRRRVSA